MVSQEKPRIGELLIEASLINAAQLQEALSWQQAHGGKVVEILIDMGYLDLPGFVRFLAQEMRIPTIDILNWEIPQEIIELIPADFARTHEVFPLDRLKNQLTVGMVCPTDVRAIKELEALTGLRVRAFVCNKPDLDAMIRAHYGGDPIVAEMPAAREVLPAPESLKVATRARHLVRLIRNIDALPSLPATVQCCREALATPGISVSEIARSIEKDPSVAANLLRLVNSAAFALPRRVSDIPFAVSFLGLKETYALVLASAVPNVLRMPERFDMAGFRRDSLFCGAACKAMIAANAVNRSASAFTAGLLHDLGRVVLALVAPERYAKIPADLNDRDLIEAEEASLGVGHPEAGYILAHNWDLPGELTDPIRFHARPEDAPEASDTVLAVALASDAWEAMTGTSEDEETFAERNAARVEAVGLNKADFFAILRGARVATEASEKSGEPNGSFFA